MAQETASETKSGAGQYFTPRPLIRAMVEVLTPQPGEVVQDPAAGTAGFLIEADRYIKQHSDEPFTRAQTLARLLRLWLRQSRNNKQRIADTLRG